MNREDIIRMAQEAGYGDAMADLHGPALERFFHMAQAAALANIDPSSFMSYQEGVEAGRLAEREACAMECIKLAHGWARLGAWGENNEFHDCAAAIRARGQA